MEIARSRTSEYDDDTEARGHTWLVLRRRWRIVAVGVLLGLLGGLLFGLTANRGYEAEADLLVSPAPTDAVFAGLPLLRDPSGTVFTAARLLEQPQVVDEVRRRLGSDISRDALTSKVTVTPIQQSGLVSVAVSDPDAVKAARIANTFVEVLIDQRTAEFQRALAGEITRVDKNLAELIAARADPTQVATVSARLATLQSLVGADDPTLSVWSRAVTPDSAKPFPIIALAIGAIVGAIVGVGAAMLRDRVDRRVWPDTPLLARLPLLATVPALGAGGVTRHLDDERSLSPKVWESFWEARLNVEHLTRGCTAPVLVLVTSAEPGDGKTVVATHLATAMSLAGRRVVVVDADQHAPGVATAFGVPARRGDGLTALVSDEPGPHRQLMTIPDQGEMLRLFMLGEDDASPSRLPDPEVLRGALRRLADRADVVVVDSAAVSDSIDAYVWASAVDVVLIAVREGRSHVPAVEALVRALELRNVAAGFVLTTRRPAPPIAESMDAPSPGAGVGAGEAGAVRHAAPVDPVSWSQRA